MGYKFTSDSFWHHDDTVEQKIQNAIDELKKVKSEVNHGDASDMLSSIQEVVERTIPELITLLDDVLEQCDEEKDGDI